MGPLGVLGLLTLGGPAVRVLAALGVLVLLQASRVLSMILRPWGLGRPGWRVRSAEAGVVGAEVLLERGVEGASQVPSPAAPTFNPAPGLASEFRGTGEAVLPPAPFLPFFSGTDEGVSVSRRGRCFRGVPSSPAEKDRKEQ